MIEVAGPSTLAVPSAWRRHDFAGETWVEPLSPDEVQELHVALRDVRRRGLSHGQFEKHDFQLPILGERLAAIAKELQDGRGFVVLRGMPVADLSIDELKVCYWGLGKHLGEVLANNVAGEFVSAVTDQGTSFTDPNRRHNTTNHGMEPHTDPADMVVLLCVEKAASGGLSSLVSATTIHQEIAASRPDLLPYLYRGFVRDVRGLGATRDPDEVTATRVPVFEQTGGRLFCSFSKTIILNGARKAGLALTSDELSAVELMHETACRHDLRIDMMLQPGDVQIINNFAMLHDRTGYVDHTDGRKRLLLRMWVNRLEGPQISPAFAAVVRTGVPPTLRGST